MAQDMEPMDIDTDFDDKENAFLHGNFLGKTSCTEKGYEELDVSELNMKLRYSITPASSPMSKSVSLSSTERNYDRGDSSCLNATESCNMTRSLNSTITINDTIKPTKCLPLQPLPAEHFADGVKQVLRPFDTAIPKCSVTPVNDDENFSLPSSLSSIAHTPEATTPTKEILKEDGGSPIMRGIKSVLSIFRTSQSPTESEKTKELSSPMNALCVSEEQQIASSTPVCNQKGQIRKISPHRESIVFKDDLEKELQWKEDTTIIFSQERVPPHKLFPQLQLKTPKTIIKTITNEEHNLDSTAMSMDISLYYNDSSVGDITMAENVTTLESDNEFLDCETTFKEESIPDLIPGNQFANIGETVSDSQSFVLAEGNTEKDSNTTNVIGSESITQNNEVKEDIEISTKKMDVSKTDYNLHKVEHDGTINADEMICTVQDTVAKTEHVLNTDQETVDEKIEHYENNDVITENLEHLEKSTYQNQIVTEENKNNPGNLINNDSIQSEIKESVNLELTRFDMTINQDDDTDTTINVMSNIDSLIRDDSDKIVKNSNEDIKEQNFEALHEIPENVLIPEVNDFELLDETITMTESKSNDKNLHIPVIRSEITTTNEILSTIEQDNEKNANEDIENISKQNIELLHEFPANIPSHELSDFEVLNNSTIVIQDKTCTTIPVITDGESEIIMNNETTEEASDKSENNKMGHNIILDNKNSVDETIQENSKKDTTAHNQSESKQLEKANLENTDFSLQKINFNECEKCENLHIDNQAHSTVQENFVIAHATKGSIELKVVNNKQINEHMASSEIIVSENNSPYVSLSTNVEDTNDKILQKDKQIDSANIESQIIREPSSPKIQSKGYSFNFDEIDDPFATKTKIRKSPSLENLIKNVNIAKDSQKSKSFSKSKSQANPKDHNTELNMKDINIVNDTSDRGETEANLIFKTENFESLSSTTFDITDDDYKIENDLDTISCTTYNIASLGQSSEIETHELQPKIDPTVILQVDTPSKTSVDNSKSSDTETPDLQPKIDPTVILQVDTPSTTSVDNTNKTIVKDVYLTVKKISSSEQYLSAEQSSQNSTTEIESDTCVNYQKTCKENSVIQTNDQKQEIAKDVLNENQNEQSQTESARVANNGEIKIINRFIKDESIQTPELATLLPPNRKIDVGLPEITFDSDINNTINNLNKVICSDDNNTNTPNFEQNADDLNCTSSSKMTDDKNDTVREINTEDEDTEEGPDLENEDMFNKLPNNNDQKQDMMQFMDFSQAENNEDPEAGEIFIDAEAYEFLLNQNTTNVVSDCGKESLFLKFDPLFAQRQSIGGVGTSVSRNNIQGPNTCHKSATSKEQPEAGPSNEPTDIFNTNHFVDKTGESLNSTAKPTMVVNPAVNPVVPKVHTEVSSKLNRRSFTLASPAMAVIDRLLSISGHHSLLDRDNTVQNNDHQTSNHNFSMKIQELLAEKELQFHTMKLESSKLKDRLSSLESQVEKLVKEGEERLSNINTLNKELEDKTKENRNMAAVVEEYERTIASLLAEREQERQKRDEERKQLIKERDEQIAHLTNMECSFNDLHSKYEKSKQIILGYKANEDAYKKTLDGFEEELAKMQNNYELLKQHATSKLNHANQELEKINKGHAAEVLKLKAMIKRKELEITSLEESLTQKTKANDELTAICDELINKVG